MSENTTNPSPQAGSNSYPYNAGYRGQVNDIAASSEHSALDFLVKQIIAGKAFCSLVKVISVSGGGTGSPATVAVQPMVDQVDGYGNRTSHGTIYNIPCFRYQAGVCAFVVDPIVGDIGVAVFADRDISQVKSTGAISGPGSSRKNSFADGLYFGSFLGASPTTFVQMTQDGIVNITAPGGLNITAPTVAITGALTATESIQAGTGGADSVTLQQHTHDGGPPPTPGT